MLALSSSCFNNRRCLVALFVFTVHVKWHHLNLVFRFYRLQPFISKSKGRDSPSVAALLILLCDSPEISLADWLQGYR